MLRLQANMELPRKESPFYNHFYKGKTILIKISGQEIARNDFARTINDIKKLTKNGVKFIIVFGGGKQINQKIADEQTVIINGIRNTTAEILDTAVLPAYNEIFEKLKKAFSDVKNCCFLKPQDVICNYKEQKKFGEVGTVENINIPKHYCQIIVMGFVGQLNGQSVYSQHRVAMGGLVNINADEIIEWLLNSPLDINEFFFLTTTGGVLNNNEQKVHLITDITLDKIIQGENKDIAVNGGMLKKMKEIKKILPQAAKIVITDIYGIPKEIESWQGNGTLIIDTKQHVIEKITEQEKIVVEEILKFYIKKGIINKLTDQEMQNILTNHYLFKVKGSPLGGFSLIENGNNSEIKGLWSNTLGTGIINILIKHIIKLAKQKKESLIMATENKSIKQVLIGNNFVPQSNYFVFEI
jgi:acetylglutamate kinase